MNKLMAVLALAIAASGLTTGCATVRETLDEFAGKKQPATAQPSVPVQPVASAPYVAPPQAASRAPAEPSYESVPLVPSSFSSLKPFKQFGHGEGHGMAYQYKDRTKADFVALLRNPARWKKEMRITCEVLVRQMVEGHKDLPFEGCEGAAAAIERDNDYAVESCRNDMFQKDNWLTVTNTDGSAFGVWHRDCLAGEPVLTYKKKPILSLKCFNVPIPVVMLVLKQAPTPLQTVVTPINECPVPYKVIWNIRDIRHSMYDALREKAKRHRDAALDRHSKKPVSNGRNNKNADAYKSDDVSWTMGLELRKTLPPASMNVNVRVRLLNPETFEADEDLGDIPLVNGEASKVLSEAQHEKIVETIWSAADVDSPTPSDGAHRFWLFPYEWRKNAAGNQYWCMYVHALSKGSLPPPPVRTSVVRQ